MDSTTEKTPRRARARKACEPCRERKRRCDGSYPCKNCERLEYDCSYVSVRKNRHASAAAVNQSNGATPASRIDETHREPHRASISAGGPVSSPAVQRGTDAKVQSVEANSAAAFVRKLALGIDPANAPRLHLFAWNLFLGGRKSEHTPQIRPVAEIVSRATMESLVTTYFHKVDPCYGFVDREDLTRHLQSRWLLPSFEDPYDVVLCGIAALGYLFSNRHAVDAELDLVATARRMLNMAVDTPPTLEIVTGWVLRVAYLRMTASPHAAWMASCTMMHTLEAAGYHLDAGLENIPGTPAHNVTPELRRRLFGVARHLHLWMSFDHGRSRVVLQNASLELPIARPGEYTLELLHLLPYSEALDPQKEVTIDGLQTTLSDILDLEHTRPPSILAQCNLVFCIYRRLRALSFAVSGTQLDRVLALTARAIKSAQSNLDTNCPWHHDANIPFQIVCILLAIDNPKAIGQLEDAIRVLSNAVQLYDTEAAKEALNTACLLVGLHQKRKDADAKKLCGIMQTYANPPPTNGQQVSAGGIAQDVGIGNDTTWFDDLMNGMPNLQGFDFSEYVADGLWEFPTAPVL